MTRYATSFTPFGSVKDSIFCSGVWIKDVIALKYTCQAKCTYRLSAGLWWRAMYRNALEVLPIFLVSVQFYTLQQQVAVPK